MNKQPHMTWAKPLQNGNYSVYYACEDAYRHAANTEPYWLWVDIIPINRTYTYDANGMLRR